MDIFSYLPGGKNFPLMPPQASEDAVKYDYLFGTITLLTIIFTIVVYVMVIVLAARYRAGTKVDRKNPPTHSTSLELLWTGVPLILALGIFYWSASHYINVRTMPKQAIDIFIIGKRWMWHTQHMNGLRENNEITVPVDKDVKLTMISQDVIHALFIPAFRAQYHVVPGRYTQLAFKANKTGRFKMLCAMHCGTQHSEMVGYVNVLSQKDFAEWEAKGGNRYKPTVKTLAEKGAQVWQEKNCGSCHGATNTVKGPTLHGILGKTRKFTNGSSQVANEDYLRLSILEPYSLITAGWDKTMPAYKGQMTEEDVLSLISYMKTLGTGGGTDAPKTLYNRDIPRGYKTNEQPDNQTDDANKEVSAGAAHAKELNNR